MRLRLGADGRNLRDENRRAWIVLSFSLAVLLVVYGVPVSRGPGHVYEPVFAGEDAAVVLRGGTLLININYAEASLLMELPGIGESRAEAIIRYREENGAFGSADELLNVPDIPGSVFYTIEDRLCVD